jgi:hypothetical protein
LPACTAMMWQTASTTPHCIAYTRLSRNSPRLLCRVPPPSTFSYFQQLPHVRQDGAGDHRVQVDQQSLAMNSIMDSAAFAQCAPRTACAP